LKDLPFSFGITLTRDNREEVDEMAALAAGLGALGVRFGHLMSDPGPATAGLEVTPAERMALDVKLNRLQAESTFPVGLTPGAWSDDLIPCAPLKETA